jgi:hypothetical protein
MLHGIFLTAAAGGGPRRTAWMLGLLADALRGV